MNDGKRRLGATQFRLKYSQAKRVRARGKVLRPALDALGALAVFTMVSVVLVSHPSAASPSVASPRTVGLVMLESPNATLIQNAVVDDDDNAPIVQIATTVSSNSSDAVYRRTSADAAWGLLAIAFSLLAALNLAFFRHLRKVYVAPNPRLNHPKSTNM